ncbi:16S rRNA (guanine(527)-N(7))-methyltransferase RsmG [Hazenella coriacea]|uniref:Ribosomal RNA small subunit methyltransferase G n=1 Tax=Hazenella coriacea TaxID=1179467 RepID=A0A4R3L8J4_9BACL|nr:16S rRNA (guanine(527)-N(7))-methyltransferase RsmG [Hazenella coriacea]TCS95488.1 16S rRNA m(7)G-527 methyltransferase [Hazenella coriacea]
MNVGEWLQKQVDSWGVRLSDQQLKQFHQYYELLIEWNRVMNLTGITEEKEVYVKHFYDSLTLARVLPVNSLQSMIDVGTGAGFPGIPLKIAFPHLQVVLLDSLKKRVGFLEEVCQELGLTEVKCIHGRAEEFAHKKEFRQSFDLATARAVAKLNVLSEYCLPFVKVNGWFIAMKGMEISEEVTEAKPALHKLGKVSMEKVKFSLPEEMGERHLLVMKKRDNSPKQYPRKAGMPTKQPIQ